MKRPFCLGLAGWLTTAGWLLGQAPSSPKVDKMTGETSIIQAGYRPSTTQTTPESAPMPSGTPTTNGGMLASCDCLNHQSCFAGGAFWFHTDYLLWWVKQGPNPEPLLTTGSPDAFVPGLIGEPGTGVLYGQDPIRFGTFSGIQLTAGAWLMGGQSLGLEARAFVLGERQLTSQYQSNGQGAPFLLRPFINTQLKAEDVATVTFPDLIAGGIQFTQSSQLWGSEFNIFHNLAADATSRFDLILGFRYLDLQETSTTVEVYGPLAVEGNTVAFNGGSVGPGHLITVTDEFKAHNAFYGGQIGAKTVFNLGSWIIDVRYQLALGANREELDVAGSSIQSSTTNVTQQTGVPGGILAQTSNMGKRSSQSFSVVPSIELKVCYDLNANVRLHAGYSFLYWTSVMRPGDQIDRVIDPTIVPTFDAFVPGAVSNRPMVLLNKSDFWAQGINFGFELRY